MKTKLLLITLLFATMPAVNAQNRERDYLKKVFANLEKIESATYYVANESWQPGDSTALSILHGVSEGKTATNGCKNRRYNTLIFS